MVIQIKTFNIFELEDARSSSISFCRSSRDQKVKAIVHVERVADVYASADGITTFTSQEWANFKGALKEVYDYAHDQLANHKYGTEFAFKLKHLLGF